MTLPAAEAPPETVVLPTRYPYQALVGRLERAIAASGIMLVARASASANAAQRGLSIPGNAVLMAFRNDFALRMLEASVDAGIEAPIRFYVTENGDGTATLSYRRPSTVFAPYRVPALDRLATEIDPIFDDIARTATDGGT